MAVEEKVKDFTKESKKRARRRRRKSIRNLCIVLAVVLLLVLNWGLITSLDPLLFLENTFPMDNQFPVLITGTSVTSVDEFYDSVAVSTDVGFYAYTAAGRQFCEFKHTLSQPAMKADGGRALVYDRGGKKYYLYSKDSELRAGNTDYAIITGDVNREGTVALATAGQGYLGQVSVYNEQGEIRFKWNCAEHPVAMALSGDNGGLYVATLSTENGQVYTSLYLLRFDQKTEVAYKRAGEVPVAVKELSGGRVLLITDQSVTIVGTDGTEQQNYDYGTRKILGYSFSEGDDCLVMLGNQLATDKGTILWLDGQLNEVTSVAASQSVADIRLSGGRMYLLSSLSLDSYNSGGELIESKPLSAVGKQMAIIGGRIYLFSATHIVKL